MRGCGYILRAGCGEPPERREAPGFSRGVAHKVRHEAALPSGLAHSPRPHHIGMGPFKRRSSEDANEGSSWGWRQFGIYLDLTALESLGLSGGKPFRFALVWARGRTPFHAHWQPTSAPPGGLPSGLMRHFIFPLLARPHNGDTGEAGGEGLNTSVY